MEYTGRYLTENGARLILAESLDGPFRIHASHLGLSADSESFEIPSDSNWHEVPEISKEKLMSPIQRAGKIVCAGLNYKDHAKEMGSDLPADPLLFMKSPQSLCGPYDPVLRPVGATTLDYEVELGIIIGKKLKYVDEEGACNGILGLTVFIDISERTMQKHRGGQWTKGKSADTFSPVGPWILKTNRIDQINKHRDLKLWLNQREMQTGNSEQMIFSPSYIVSHISQFMSLYPGDIISTGTPPGVGMGRNPPVYMNPGDILECTISELGSQKHIIEQDTL